MTKTTLEDAPQESSEGLDPEQSNVPDTEEEDLTPYLETIRQIEAQMRRHGIVLPRALWVLHTRTYQAFPVTPYLDIHSHQPQCGKTVCLEVLSVLCDQPWLANAPRLPVLARKLLTSKKFITTLLDDRHITLGDSNRQAILGLLNCGFRRGARYTDFNSGFLREFEVFRPKAFAGLGPLPHSLADRSIPVVNLSLPGASGNCSAGTSASPVPRNGSAARTLKGMLAKTLPTIGGGICPNRPSCRITIRQGICLRQQNYPIKTRVLSHCRITLQFRGDYH